MLVPRRAFLLFASVSASLPATAFTSLARAVTLEQLVRASKYAVLGTPLEARSRWEAVGRRKRIVTYTQIRVDEALAGPTQDATPWVRTLGGQVGTSARSSTAKPCS